ncbi:MAG: choice-of-anchor tandem repeat GloVer-containing protein [Chthoniobacterales bacterium]
MKSVRCLRFRGFPTVPSSFLRLAYASCLLTITVGAQTAPAAPIESVLYNFNVIRTGDQPQAALTPGLNGVYYGTTDVGGASGNGTVFELIPPAAGQSGWSQKVIHTFTGPPDGSTPSSGLMLGKDGVLYGVTGNGGTAGYGVVFMLTPPASGQGNWTETILYNFEGGSDGIAPYGTLIADGNGILYGSTVGGGSANAGVVFSLTPPAAGQKEWAEAVLYTFHGNPDGVSPTNGLVRDDTGTIYGMTSAGGTNGAGTVYRLTAPANGGGAWSETILYNFAGAPNGSFPNGGLVRDGNGILYGVTFAGGTSGWGTIFSLTPPVAGQTAWSENVLYSFTGGADGGSPDNTPVLGSDGTVYGTNNFNSNGYGTVFAVTPPAPGQSAWTEATLVNFDGTNGANPIGLVLNGGGTLIGTTYDGGTQDGNGGIVFKLTQPREGASAWGYKILYRFPDTRNDAEYPAGALLRGSDGTLFGGTSSGGTHNHGAIFKLTPPAAGETAWHETVIHSFNGANGSQATGPMVEGNDGALYGVTTAGGPFGGAIGGYGTVYVLTPPSDGHEAWTEKILYPFTGVANSDGAFPQGGLIADTSGALYGTTSQGGIATSNDQEGNGTVFKLTPPVKGQDAWTATIIYRFSGPDGSAPHGSFLLGKNGELYGTTYVGGSAGEGTVFELTPPANPGGQWTETVLYSFNDINGNDGAIPGAEQLVADASGALYGTTSQGGLYGDGTVFKLIPPDGARAAWIEVLLHSFNGTDGFDPNVGLLAGTDGFYGVTPQGGAFNWGAVFKLTAPLSGTVWNVTVLHSFNVLYDRGGVGPNGALIQDPSGNLYGTTFSGGDGVGGVVFTVTAP